MARNDTHDEQDQGVLEGTPVEPSTSTEVALPPITPAEIESILATRAIRIDDWLRALLRVAEFEETASEDAQLSIIASILTASSLKSALGVMEEGVLKRFLGTEPGDRTPVLDFQSAIPLASSFEEGPSCFCVVTATVITTGERIQFPIGAVAVQTTLAKALWEGWLPFQASIVRRRKPTRGGFYPLNLEAGV